MQLACVWVGAFLVWAGRDIISEPRIAMANKLLAERLLCCADEDEDPDVKTDTQEEQKQQRAQQQKAVKGASKSNKTKRTSASAPLKRQKRTSQPRADGGIAKADGAEDDEFVDAGAVAGGSDADASVMSADASDGDHHVEVQHFDKPVMDRASVAKVAAALPKRGSIETKTSGKLKRESHGVLSCHDAALFSACQLLHSCPDNAATICAL